MEFVIHPIERRTDVVDFTVAIVVFALAQSGSAKVEPQHRKAKTVQRVLTVKYNLVMDAPPEGAGGRRPRRELHFTLRR